MASRFILVVFMYTFMVYLTISVTLHYKSTQINAELLWTPIYINGNNQVDMWTKQSKGCSCPWAKKNDHQQCACCVSDGGCLCGKNVPHRCTQCGLENHCEHMCNVTLSATDLQLKSGKTFGQIKSLSLETAALCWYTFIPEENHRVELQIYRLVNIGTFNGTNCIGGSLQIVSGNDLQYSTVNHEICGTNERYTPPVVFFSDDGIVTLIFQITQDTARSQFLAYFSFTQMDNANGLGNRAKGGMKLQNTDCDWLYQEIDCNKSKPCFLASPGYPGVYPIHKQCNYHIASTNKDVQIRLIFTSLNIPPDCNSAQISIHNGTSSSNPLLTTICGNERKVYDYFDKNIVLVFSTKRPHTPIEYNGFVVKLIFFKNTTLLNKTVANEKTELITTDSTLIIQPTAYNGIRLDTKVKMKLSSTKLGNSTLTNNTFKCNLVISANNTRSGHFDTREYEWHPVCRILFLGLNTDIVHVSLFNYRLRTPSCQSVIEVFDSDHVGNAMKSVERLCSPISKDEHDKRGISKYEYFSTGSALMMTLTRLSMPLTTNDAEFLAGAYFFHDEQISGTLQAPSVCDVKYYGNHSPSAGNLNNPSLQHLFWNIDGHLMCRQHFIPATNQSITIRIDSVNNMTTDPVCITKCGDNGCQCIPSLSPIGSAMSTVDHFLITTDDNGPHSPAICLCGNIHSDGLPVTIRTWSPLVVTYSVAYYTWSRKGFLFTASYAFNSDGVCAKHVYTVHSGEITIKQLPPADHLNYFYVQSCSWTLHSNVERQLQLNISSPQNRPCQAWNISIYEYSPDVSRDHLGHHLRTFCSREHYKQYLLPRKLNTVVIRLYTQSRTYPQFNIKWKSQVFRANIKLYSGISNNNDEIQPHVPSSSSLDRFASLHAPNCLMIVTTFLIMLY